VLISSLCHCKCDCHWLTRAASISILNNMAVAKHVGGANECPTSFLKLKAGGRNWPERRTF